MAKEIIEYTADQAYSNYDRVDRVSEFGGKDDLWGATEITVAQLKDPNFSVLFDMELGAATFRADEVKVEVFYLRPAVGAQNATVYPEHENYTQYNDGDIIWVIADDGVAHEYVASGTGYSGVIPPTFPSFSGDTIVDGEIEWIESGVYQPASLPPYYESGLLSGAIGRNAAGQRTFLVVGQKGVVKTSEDGETWTIQDSGVVDTLRGVAAHEDGFVAVGDNGVIISSPDGVTWSREESGAKDSFFSVDYDRTNGTFSAVGKDGLIRQKAGNAWNVVNR